MSSLAPVDRNVRAPAATVRRADSVLGLRIVVWLVTAAVVLTPLTAMVVLALSGQHLPMLASQEVLTAARNSLVTSLISAVAAVLIGTILAIMLDHTNLRGRGLLRILLLTPMFIPPFVGAISWLGLFGPTQGVNQLWRGWFGEPLWNLYGVDGVIVLLTIHSYPLTYLIIGAALRRIPSDLEQAARMSGASAMRSMWDVTIPLLRPAIIASGFLTFVANLADFGIPAILGLPERYYTLATLIYRYIQSGTVAQPLQVVSTIGVVLLLIAVAAAVLDARLQRRRTELDATAAQRVPVDLAAARGPLTLVTWLVGVSITLLPVLALTVQALLPAPGVPISWENLTVGNFSRAIRMDTVQVGVQNSVLLAGLAALICAVLGLVISLLATRTRARSNAALTGLAMLPQAIPGTVIAVGWLIVAPALGLFNTPWLILVAYVMAFLALVVQTTSAPLRGIPTALEDAARISGASQAGALRDVSVRLAIPAAITGGAMVFLTAVRELTISALLRSPGSQTLGVAIFDLQQSGNYNASAALSVLVSLVGLLGIAVLSRTLLAEGTRKRSR